MLGDAPDRLLDLLIQFGTPHIFDFFQWGKVVCKNPVGKQAFYFFAGVIEPGFCFLVSMCPNATLTPICAVKQQMEMWMVVFFMPGRYNPHVAGYCIVRFRDSALFHA